MSQGKLHFVGGGQMAEAIIKGLIKNNAINASEISVSDVDNTRLHLLHNHYGVQINESKTPDYSSANIIILAIRPQDDLATIGQLIQASAMADTIILSLIAGVKISQLSEFTGNRFPIVRVIPNTLTETGFGYSGVAIDDAAATKKVTENALLNAFLTGFGKVEYMDESLIDTFTGFGVAGPNYVYYFIESLADAGVLAGLSRKQAWKIALENVKGAAAMLEQTALHPRQLLDINNSAGGVGIHGLYELNNSDFAAGLQRSVVAAVKRTRELGERK
jgi:pyrroline-5-carboxylate reductase